MYNPPLARATPTEYSGSVSISVNEDITFQALRHLKANPQLSQRQLAKALGISLGRTNYCLHALIKRGLVKVETFCASKKKLQYSYLLTPEGIETKARITARFLQRKRAEYDALRKRILVTGRRRPFLAAICERLLAICLLFKD